MDKHALAQYAEVDLQRATARFTELLDYAGRLVESARTSNPEHSTVGLNLAVVAVDLQAEAAKVSAAKRLAEALQD